jgi:hypothetical protein
MKNNPHGKNEWAFTSVTRTVKLPKGLRARLVTQPDRTVALVFDEVFWESILAGMVKEWKKEFPGKPCPPLNVQEFQKIKAELKAQISSELREQGLQVKDLPVHGWFAVDVSHDPQPKNRRGANATHPSLKAPRSPHARGTGIGNG